MDRRVKDICAERRRRNAAGRRKLPFTEQEKSELERIKPALKELRGRYKTQKAAAYGSEANKAALKAIDAGSNEEHKQVRRVASEEWGLYWGTYLLIEEAAKKFRKGSPPKFRGFRGEGSLAVQIHSTPDSRFTTERLQAEGGNTVFSLCAEAGRRATLRTLHRRRRPAIENLGHESCLPCGAGFYAAPAPAGKCRHKLGALAAAQDRHELQVVRAIRTRQKKRMEEAVRPRGGGDRRSARGNGRRHDAHLPLGRRGRR